MTELKVNPVDESKGLCTVSRLRRIPLASFGCIFAASVFFTTSSAMVKKLRDVDFFLIFFMRAAVVFFISFPVVIYEGLELIPREKLVKLLCGAFGSNLLNLGQFYGFQRIPLGDTRMIGLSAPLFVAVLGRIFLKEPCGVFETINITVCLIGTVIVMQPPFLFGSVSAYTTSDFLTALIVFGATLAGSISTVATRSLKDTSAFLFTAWTAVTGASISCLAMVITGLKSSPSVADWSLVVINGIVSCMAVVTAVLSLKLETASTVSLTSKAIQTLLAYLVQVVFFDEVPSSLSILGACIVGMSVAVAGVRGVVADKRSPLTTLRSSLCLPPLKTETSES